MKFLSYLFLITVLSFYFYSDLRAQSISFSESRSFDGLITGEKIDNTTIRVASREGKDVPVVLITGPGGLVIYSIDASHKTYLEAFVPLKKGEMRSASFKTNDPNTIIILFEASG